MGTTFTVSNAKLTAEIVVEARKRAAAGESIRGMAREYGVSQSVMHSAVKGIRWAHVRQEVAS